MGITVAKASRIPNPAQETPQSTRLGTPTSQKSGTTTTSSSSTSRKRSGKEKNTFGAMIRGLSGQGDGEGQETHGRASTSGTANAAAMTSDPSTQDSHVKSSSKQAGQTSGAQEKAGTQDGTSIAATQFSLPTQTDDTPAPTLAKDTTSGLDGDQDQSSGTTDPTTDMSLQVQGMQAWPALMLAQTVMPAQTTAPQGQKPVGTSSSSATGTAAASTMTSGSVQTGSMLSVTAALDTILAALSSASPAQSAPSAQTMPGATPSSLSPATVADGSVTPRAKQTQIASVSIPATNSLQPTQDSSTGTDTVSASAPTEMDTLLASIGQQATAPVMSQGSAVSSPLSGRTSPAALSTSSSATTPVAVSAQPAQASDGTTTPQQSQTAGVSNITVETSARADSRDSLASLATSPDHTASAGYNAVTAPTDGAGIVAGTEHQGNGLSDHSGTSEGERGDDAQQQAGTASPASMTLSTDLSAPSAFTLEHAGQTTDTQSVQAQTQTDEEDEAGNQILSSPGISRSADGQTSVSMTIMTADSTPVHVRLEGTDGITTGIVLQSEDEATARHLATNRHELVTALGATGMEVGNLKIDVVAATDNGANLTDQGASGDAGYDGSASGGMSGNGAGQNGGQSFQGSAWGSGFVSPAQGGVDIEGGASNATTGAGRTYAGKGINITA